MTDVATDPRGIGDNLPPEPDVDLDRILGRLSEKYQDLPVRLAKLLESFNAAPLIITTDEQNKDMSDLKAEFRALRKTADSNREEEKQPFWTAGKMVDGWFSLVRDPAKATITKITQRKTTYEREVAASKERVLKEEERKAREEANRLAREAEKALEQAVAREAEARAIIEKAASEAKIRHANELAARAARAAEELKASQEAARRETEARNAAERAAAVERNREEEQARLEAAAHARGVREAEERTQREKDIRLARDVAMREAADLEKALAAQKAADNAKADAAKAQTLANAKAADMSRSRSDHGAVSSLHTYMDNEPEDPACPDPVDRANVDLEKLRPHISMEALKKAVNAFVKIGGTDLRATRIFQNTVSRG